MVHVGNKLAEFNITELQDDLTADVPYLLMASVAPPS